MVMYNNILIIKHLILWLHTAIKYDIIYKKGEFMNSYEELGIYELRAIAREVGVRYPTTYKKSALILKIENIKNGMEKPYFKTSKQGRPAKNINIKPIKDYMKNLEINSQSAKIMVEEYRLLLESLKYFNIKMNILIDNFLEKTEHINNN